MKYIFLTLPLLTCCFGLGMDQFGTGEIYKEDAYHADFKIKDSVAEMVHDVLSLPLVPEVPGVRVVTHMQVDRHELATAAAHRVEAKKAAPIEVPRVISPLVADKQLTAQQTEHALTAMENGQSVHISAIEPSFLIRVRNGIYNYLLSPIINHPVRASLAVFAGFIAAAYYEGYLDAPKKKTASQAIKADVVESKSNIVA